MPDVIFENNESNKEMSNGLTFSKHFGVDECQNSLKKLRSNSVRRKFTSIPTENS